MIRDITLGQYYNTESIIHRLDPRTKMVLICIYIIMLFMYKNPLSYIVSSLFLIVLIALSKVPVNFIFRGMKAIFFLLIFTAFFNIFFIDGEILASWWIFKISKEGLINAAYMIIRLILLIVSSSLITLTTTPSNLTDGLEKLLKPLKIFKVPVHDVSMMMSIALRFIPILLEETDKIMKAQLARGADFENGNIFKRAKSLIPVLIPLFVSAFRRANDLALAMEARCYQGGESRTKMKPLKYKKADYLMYLIIVLYISGLIFANKYNLLLII